MADPAIERPIAPNASIVGAGRAERQQDRGPGDGGLVIGVGHVGATSRAGTVPRRRRAALAKVCLDMVVAMAGAIILSPVLVIVSLCVLITGRGPILFRQRRVGRGGRLFSILKFRTMRVNAETVLRSDPVLYQTYLSNDFKLPAQTDPRLTSLGRFLRKTSLDELPQLFNVLAGHMSLVGPRPVVPDELAKYGEFSPLYLRVRPGMTGAWQASGRSELTYAERVRLDAEYVVSWTIRRDLALLMRTVPAVIGRRGAH